MTDNDLTIYDEQYYILSATFNRLVPLFCADLAMLQSFPQAYGRPPTDRGYHVNGRAFSPPFLFGNHPINYVTLTGRCRDLQVLGDAGERGFSAVILSLTDDTGGQPVEAIYARTDCTGPASGGGGMKIADYINKNMTLTGYLTRSERFNRTQMKLIKAPDIFPVSEAVAAIAVKSGQSGGSTLTKSLAKGSWENEDGEDVLAEELRRSARTLQFRREVLARPWVLNQDDMDGVLSGVLAAKSAGALRPEEFLEQIAAAEAATNKPDKDFTEKLGSVPPSTSSASETEENLNLSANDKTAQAEKKSCGYDDDDGFEDDGLSVTDSASNDEDEGDCDNQGTGSLGLGLASQKEGVARGLVLSRRGNVLELRDTGVYSSDVMSSARWGASSDEEYGSDVGKQASKKNESPVPKKRKVDSELLSREMPPVSVSLEQQNASGIKVPEVSGNSVVDWDSDEAYGFTDIDNEELTRAVQEEEEQEQLRASRLLTTGSSYLEKQPPPPGVVLPPSGLSRQHSTSSQAQAQGSLSFPVLQRQEGTRSIAAQSHSSISVSPGELNSGSVLGKHQQAMNPARAINLQTDKEPKLSTSTTEHVSSRLGTRANTDIITNHTDSKVDPTSSVLIISDSDNEDEVVDWSDDDNDIDEKAPVLAAVAPQLQVRSMPLPIQSVVNNSVRQQPPPPGVDISAFGLPRPPPAGAAKTFAYGDNDYFDDIDDIGGDLTDEDGLIKEFEERKRQKREGNSKDTKQQEQSGRSPETSAQSEEEGQAGTQDVVDWSGSDNELASDSDGSASVAEVMVTQTHFNANQLKSSPPPLPHPVSTEPEKFPESDRDSIAWSTRSKSPDQPFRTQASLQSQREASVRSTPSLPPRSSSVWSDNHGNSKASYIDEKRQPNDPQRPKHEQCKVAASGLPVNSVPLKSSNSWLPDATRNTSQLSSAAATNGEDDLIYEPQDPNSDDFIADAFSSTPAETNMANTAYYRMVAEPGSATRQRLGYCVLEFIRMQPEHRASRSDILYNSDLVHYTYIAQEHDPKNISPDLTHEEILDEVLQKHAQHGYIFVSTPPTNRGGGGGAAATIVAPGSGIAENHYEALGAWNLMAPLTKILGTPIGSRQIKLAYLVDTLTKVRTLRRRGVVTIAPPLVRDLVDGILAADTGVWASDRVGGVWHRQD